VYCFDSPPLIFVCVDIFFVLISSLLSLLANGVGVWVGEKAQEFRSGLWVSIPITRHRKRGLLSSSKYSWSSETEIRRPRVLSGVVQKAARALSTVSVGVHASALIS
jgi:hypothetical protein